MKITKLLTTPIFVIFIQSVIIVVSFGIIFNIIRIGVAKNNLMKSNELNNNVSEKSEEINSADFYLNSQTFHIKYAKKYFSNKKVKGESVYDTTKWEQNTQTSDKSYDYTPTEIDQNSDSIVDIWYKCISGKVQENCFVR
jgi:hypothetical protein